MWQVSFLPSRNLRQIKVSLIRPEKAGGVGGTGAFRHCMELGYRPYFIFSTAFCGTAHS
jgi:hypothetical protein